MLHEVEVIQAEAVEVVLEAGALALVDEVDSSLAGADEAAPVTVAVDEEEASRIVVAEEVAAEEEVMVEVVEEMVMEVLEAVHRHLAHCQSGAVEQEAEQARVDQQDDSPPQLEAVVHPQKCQRHRTRAMVQKAKQRTSQRGQWVGGSDRKVR